MNVLVSAVQWAETAVLLIFPAAGVVLAVAAALFRWHRERRKDREWAAGVARKVRAAEADFRVWEQDFSDEGSVP